MTSAGFAKLSRKRERNRATHAACVQVVYMLCTLGVWVVRPNSQHLLVKSRLPLRNAQMCNGRQVLHPSSARHCSATLCRVVLKRLVSYKLSPDTQLV